MSNIESLIINMDDINAKRDVMNRISTLKGRWEVTLKERKRVRSLSANAYYFAAVVTPYMHYLREEWGEPRITKEQAHDELKLAILGGQKIVNPKTGEEKLLVPDSHNLDTAEFADFVERAAAFVEEFCKIVILPSEMFREAA